MPPQFPPVCLVLMNVKQCRLRITRCNAGMHMFVHSIFLILPAYIIFKIRLIKKISFYFCEETWQTCSQILSLQ